MYPNPQEVLPLPPRPDLQQYRKRAKDLAKACKAGAAAAVRDWVAGWMRDLIALQPDDGRAEHPAELQRHVDQVAEFAHRRLAAAGCALSQAQFVIARAHGFQSWPRLVQHLEALGGASSPISAFETAADAIIAGNLATVGRLLREAPELVHARSTREHRATLLHYVSANGVENYRQKTPKNIVSIARLLIDAGAEVDAEADVYGGGATPLGLVVTSAHPRLAGVQKELADLLLERGARMDSGIVRDCLANGCPEAAEHLVELGAALDLEAAAGLGRLDVVRRYCDERGRPLPGTARTQLTAALFMACWYDRVEVAELLLDQGVDPGVRQEGRSEGQTALHVAAYQGFPRLVELLLRRGAPVNVNDDTYGTPPLVWALHAWLAESRSPAEPYKAVLRKLAAAGAEVKREWLEDERLRADPGLFAILAARVSAG